MVPERPLVSPVLVGRDEERAALLGALDRAWRGAGEVVLVAGEAGVGKTRLLGELRDEAERRGGLVLMGTCFEQDRTLPLEPLRDLVRRMLVGAASENELPESDLLAILPELTTRGGAVPAGEDGNPPDAGRLALAFERLFARQSNRSPVLVAIEDLHWSDETSLDVLRRLARRLGRLPVLLLATYREGEETGPLEHFLAELTRDRAATGLRLRPLDRAGLATMIRAIFSLDRQPGADFLETLAELTEGNPFFVEEVLASLVATGDIVAGASGWTRRPLTALRIPRTVQDAVRRSVAGLSTAGRETLELAAVAGRRFDFTLIQAVTGREEGEVLGLVKELIAARLIVESSAETFAFRHALIREAVYAGLLGRERVLLHRRIASALEELHLANLETCLEDLAYHWAEAGAWERVLTYAPRAGERARSLGAPRAAVIQYDRALLAAERLGRSPDPAILRARGLALAMSGRFEAALADFQATLDLTRAAGDSRGEWQALLDLGFHWTERDYAEAHRYLAAALAKAREIGDPATVAHSLNRMGNWFANQEQPGPARARHTEALAIFTASGDLTGQAQTHDLLGMAAGLAADHRSANRHGQEAARLFRELGDRHGLVMAILLSHLPAIVENDLAVGHASIVEALPFCLEALTLTQELGWRSGESFVHALVGSCYGAIGRFEEGAVHLREAREIAEEIEHRQWIVQSCVSAGAYYRDRLDPAAAEEVYLRAEALAGEMHSPVWINLLGGMLASTRVLRGDLAGAAAILAERLRPDTPSETSGQRHLWAARAELALASGDATHALTIVDRLFATAAELEREGQIPRLAGLKAACLTALGRLAEAIALLEDAIETARRLSYEAIRLRLHAAAAGVLQSAGEVAAATRQIDEAMSLIDRFAKSIEEAAARDAFHRAAHALLPGRQRQRRPAAPGGLTPREQEIARLIAVGRTNREIATTLFVSERTVEAHVGNILQKRGFSSRAQVAAWVASHDQEPEAPADA